KPLDDAERDEPPDIDAAEQLRVLDTPRFHREPLLQRCIEREEGVERRSASPTAASSGRPGYGDRVGDVRCAGAGCLRDGLGFRGGGG
ncbi:MAG: hypothetical protein Q9157_006482, partial [Trypethelium eluteriae]